METKTYIVTSHRIKKRWIVTAKDVADATGKVVYESRHLLSELEKMQEEDLDIDLQVDLHTNLTEIIYEG